MGVVSENGVRMSSGMLRLVAGFVALIFLSPRALYGQQLAMLSISVTDPSRSAITEARITLRNIATGAKRTIVSSGTGLVVVRSFCGQLPANRRTLIGSCGHDNHQCVWLPWVHYVRSSFSRSDSLLCGIGSVEHQVSGKMDNFSGFGVQHIVVA